jgi:hypothetical protein
MSNAYVYGYDPRMTVQLQDQAKTLVELLHSGTAYPAGHRVLEAGCRVKRVLRPAGPSRFGLFLS